MRRTLTILRKMLAVLVVTLGVLLGLVALTLGWVLHTEAGTRYALRTGLDRYLEGIPGSIRVGALEGTLADGVRLRDVRVADRDDRPLVTAERLELELDAWALIAAEVPARVGLYGSVVTLRQRADGASAFGDLSATGPATPSDPSAPTGPALPVALDVRLLLRDVTLRQAAPDAEAPATMLVVERLEAHAEGEGHEATLAVRPTVRATLGEALVPGGPVDIRRLALNAAWDAPTLRVDHLRLASSLGRVSADDLDWNTEQTFVRGSLSVEAAAGALDRYVKLPVDSPISLKLRVEGTPEDVVGTLVLRVDQALVALQATGRVAPPIDVTVAAVGHDLPVGADANFGFASWATVDGDDLDDLTTRVRLECVDCSLPEVGPVDLARAPRADLTFMTAGVAIDRRPIGALGGTVGYRRGRVDTHLRWVMGGGVTDLKARVPLSVDLAAGQVRWRQNEPHQVSLAARGVTEATLLPFARVPVGLDLNAEVEIEGTVDAPEGDLTVQGTVHHATAGVVPVKLEAEVQPDEQSLGLRADLRGSSVEIAVDLEAPIARIRRGDANIEDVPFEAHVEIGALDLALFTNALPVSLYGPEGKLTASLDGQGTLGEPDLEGRIGVDDGALSVVDLNQRLERIQLEVALGADEVKIERLTARSGAGKLEANGAVRLDAGGPQGEVTMRLQDFPVVRPGMPRGLLDVRVRTVVESSHDEQRIEIGLHRPDVRLVGSNVPAAEPIASTDIVRFAHGEEDEEDDASDAGAAPSTRRVLVVRLADPLDISGRGVVMRWAGKVIIVQDDETSVSGGFEARDGDVDVLGRRFVIERGRVTMPAGGDEPYASLAASTEVGSYRITATLDGPVSKPNLELSSSPPLPDYEVLSVLINGAPDSADGDQSVEREAAALLAAFQSPALEQALNDRLGIDRVGLTFGETVDQPILTLGKRVARDVYVETRFLHNTPEDENSTEAVVRYDFLPRWSVETSYGDAGEGEIELSWRRSFGDRGQLSDPTAAPRAEGEAPTDCACIDADGPCPCEPEDDEDEAERAPEVATTDARRGGGDVPARRPR